MSHIKRSMDNKKDSKRPLVTIGIPVYNGGGYLSEAIESVLSQSFDDFELIISDNCSNDQTEKICHEYTKQDARIVYIRQKVNMGGVRNFNYLCGVAKGKYFSWLAADDFLHTDFLRETVSVLDCEEQIGLVAVDFRVIDAHGKSLGIERLQSLRRSVSWATRQAHLMSKPSDNAYFSIFGLFRTKILCSILKNFNIPTVASNMEYLYLARAAAITEVSSLPLFLRFYRKHAECAHLQESAKLKRLGRMSRNIEKNRQALVIAISQKRELLFSKIGLRQKFILFSIIIKSWVYSKFQFNPKNLNHWVRSIIRSLGFDMHRIRFSDDAGFDIPSLLSWCNVDAFIDSSESFSEISNRLMGFTKKDAFKQICLNLSPDAPPNVLSTALLDSLSVSKRPALYIQSVQLTRLTPETREHILRYVTGLFIECPQGTSPVTDLFEDGLQKSMFESRFSLWNIHPVKRSNIHGKVEVFCYVYVLSDLVR